FIELAAEFAGHLAQISGHLPERPQHRRQVFRPNHHDENNPDDEKFGPADIKHSTRLLEPDQTTQPRVVSLGSSALCSTVFVASGASSSLMPFLKLLMPLATSPISSGILPRPNSTSTITRTISQCQTLKEPITPTPISACIRCMMFARLFQTPKYPGAPRQLSHADIRMSASFLVPAAWCQKAQFL